MSDYSRLYSGDQQRKRKNPLKPFVFHVKGTWWADAIDATNGRLLTEMEFALPDAYACAVKFANRNSEAPNA